LAHCRFSRRAEDDLLGIADYTLRTWGEDQAIRYITGLEEFCQMLVSNPALGRSCDDIRLGLRRMESSQHVVFYREETEGILIARILHQDMLPERHAMDDDDCEP
jgi:toxin ParE1/3/4